MLRDGCVKLSKFKESEPMSSESSSLDKKEHLIVICCLVIFFQLMNEMSTTDAESTKQDVGKQHNIDQEIHTKITTNVPENYSGSMTTEPSLDNCDTCVQSTEATPGTMALSGPAEEEASYTSNGHVDLHKLVPGDTEQLHSPEFVGRATEETDNVVITPNPYTVGRVLELKAFGGRKVCMTIMHVHSLTMSPVVTVRFDTENGPQEAVLKLHDRRFGNY